jgi:hypothetical protein
VRPVPVNRSVLRATAPRRLVGWSRLPWRWQALALLAGSGAGWVLVIEGGAWTGRVPLWPSTPSWLLDWLTQTDAAPFLVRVHAAIVQCAGLCVLAPLVVAGTLIIALGWVALATTGDTQRARRWLRAGQRALHLSFLAG